MHFGGNIRPNKTGFCILAAILVLLYLYSTSGKNSITSDKQISLRQLLKVAIKSAENGGKQVLAVKNNFIVKSKGKTKEGLDDSVTTADNLSHCSMLQSLRSVFPTLKIVSEESKVECENNEVLEEHFKEIKDLEDEFVNEEDVTVWIDPLDATREYTEKLFQYVTTMVCVAVKGKPVIGVIHKPFSNHTSWGWVNHKVSEDLASVTKPIRDSTLITISRSHSGKIKEVLNNNFKNIQLIMAAGAGFKVLEVATANVDAYLHITAIKKWDICAGNAILDAVGGKMTDKFNNLIDYSDNGKYVNENGLIATSENHEFYVGKL